MDFYILNRICDAENYKLKLGLTMILINASQNGELKVKRNKNVYNFCINEIKKLTLALDDSKGFKYNDEILSYGEQLFHLLIVTEVIDEDNLPLLQNFSNVVKKFRGPINTILELGKKKECDPKDADKLLAEIEKVKDIDLKNCTFVQLLEQTREDQLHFEPTAKKLIADYIFDKLKDGEKCYPALTEDQKYTLFILSDLTFFYDTENTEKLMLDLAKFDDEFVFATIRYQLHKNKEPDTDMLTKLANNLEYGALLYGLLGGYKRTDLFPANINNPTYLAKSALVHWLAYPTELGQVPDKIEFLGVESVKKRDYYIYKFMTNSENLESDRRNVWLVGWGNAQGGTFSNFDKLSDFECNRKEKTLKLIKKSIIKTGI
mgnify:CR=1 FL=1